MRNFLKLANSVDYLPLLQEIVRRPDLWNQHTVRTFHEQSAHRTLDDIILRYNRFDQGDDFVEAVCSRIEVVNYPAMLHLPQARALIMQLMARVGGEHLGRAFISRIRPGGTIPPHTDRIGPAEEAFPDRVIPAVYYDRYHIPLQSSPGCYFRCGDETALMLPGEAWWFQNQLDHEVVNNSGADRVHLVIDIHTGRDAYTPIGWDATC